MNEKQVIVIHLTEKQARALRRAAMSITYLMYIDRCPTLPPNPEYQYEPGDFDALERVSEVLKTKLLSRGSSMVTMADGSQREVTNEEWTRTNIAFYEGKHKRLEEIDAELAAIKAQAMAKLAKDSLLTDEEEEELNQFVVRTDRLRGERDAIMAEVSGG